MPKYIEEKLKKKAEELVKKGKMKSTKKGAYVYGTLKKIENKK